ncbi:nucleoside deaminase [Methanohalophilus halophilus]|uniref:Cytosine deaminase n=1 Tax=Methanohalophilus halophilus TaxID=2177 RepID=A0A1L3Q001_9EURY|nr:nucleoside deaminase [Methanohalophilus halophilus]APH38179.1 tRNA-specific adenosine deaminase [Methanohalophilus halophilus]RNI10952.1 nucleoside deaminase [Methanohalophilus halophilus]SDW79726.1 cytosine deaminase [Methanohalophilus halophilus]
MDQFMKEAINEAMAGRDSGGIPIGSVLVRNGKVIGRGHNLRVQEDDPLAHAEISCMRDAGRIGSYADTVLYSTLMPCYLCAGAVVQFGIKKVVAGESETFEGAQDFLRSKGVVVVDLDISECKMLMKEFIREYPELWNEDIGESEPY